MHQVPRVLHRDTQEGLRGAKDVRREVRRAGGSVRVLISRFADNLSWPTPTPHTQQTLFITTITT